jgi:flavin reductase (DIM6/NTAB) family NADH-FMN oxidoreductase RutF
MEFLAKQLSDQEAYKLLIGCVVPRPIAWVSTISNKGVANIAPFSFFTVVCTSPPKLGITIIPDKNNNRDKKDTLLNIEETKNFVVNIADLSLAEQLVQTSYPYQYGVDEFAQCGLTSKPSIDIASPCIKEAPINMECRLSEVLKLGYDGSYFVIGEVVRFHIQDEFLVEERKVDQQKLQAFGRMGGPLYTKAINLFSMKASVPPKQQ